MRKMKYLLGVGVMSTALLFGCGSNDEDETKKSSVNYKITASELIEDIQDADTMNDITSMSFDMDMVVDCEVEMNGQSQALDMKLDSTMKINLEDKLFFADLLLENDGLAQEMDLYAEMSDEDEAMMYVNTSGMWLKMATDPEDFASMFELPAINTDESAIDFSEITEYLIDPSVDVSDDSYTLSGTLNLEKIINEIAEGDDEISESDIEEALDLIGDLELNVSITVDANYNLMGFSLEIPSFETEIEGITFKINSIKFSLLFSDLNNTTIVIPDEAYNAVDYSSLYNDYYGDIDVDYDYDYDFEDEDEDEDSEDEDSISLDDFEF